jgi:hypothetical protein
MEIGVLPDPERHPLWPGIYALLEPAADLGGVAVLERDELVWIVSEGGEIKAAATTRMLVNGSAEIILCGGGEMHDWAVGLADMICRWAKDEGADRVRLAGRKGWARVLGWPEVNGVIEKAL